VIIPNSCEWLKYGGRMIVFCNGYLAGMEEIFTSIAMIFQGAVLFLLFHCMYMSGVVSKNILLKVTKLLYVLFDPQSEKKENGKV
jgi:hypothetical protein